MKLIQHISLYWKCQLAGWSVAALYWGVVGYLGTGFSWTLACIHFVADVCIYIILSHLYRNFSLKYAWQRLSIQQLVIRLVPAIIILGLAFMLLTISKNYLVRSWFEPGFTESLTQQFTRFGLATFATGMRLMSIWLLSYYGYHFAIREINAVKESSRLSMIAKDAAFNNLSAQLNPHFFFNSLNSIKALVLENPHETRRAIDLLSDLLRTSLYRRDAGLVSIQEEMELVKDYLELEKIRFEKRLATTIDIDESVLVQMILPFSIQVLVENAIKHGIAPKKEGGVIDISVLQQNQHLVIAVQNPGKLNMETTKGLGLKNLRERLQLQFARKASFQIVQENEETVMATIIIPVQ